jgi:uroporphyrinogen III methyltransferase/synthase
MADRTRPLTGKRIVITRAPEKSQEFARLLEEQGAEVLFLPCVRCEPIPNSPEFEEAVNELELFDWVILTSGNAALHFGLKIEGRPEGLHLGGRPLVAAVGPATAAEARKWGLPVEYVARGHRGEALAEELGKRLAGRRVLLPRSDQADESLPRLLRSFGAEVTEVVTYKTMAPVPSADAQARVVRVRGEADVLTFFSPSAFENFAKELETEDLVSLSKHLIFAVIGPVTAKAIRDAGLPVAIESPEATVPEFVQAIVEFFVRRSTGVPS